MSDGRVSNFIDANMILRKDGKIVFVLRKNTKWMSGYYCLPAGKVNQDETFSRAAIREAREEVGVLINQEDVRHVHTMHRREGSDWVSMFFEASAWKGNIQNTEPYIHASVDWLDPKNLPKNIVPSVRFVIEQIERGNIYSEFGWKE